MSLPEPRESIPKIEAMLNYLVDTGEKPESYGGMRFSEAEQKRKGKYQEYRMPVYNGRSIRSIVARSRRFCLHRARNPSAGFL